jgi:hypothetical protein
MKKIKDYLINACCKVIIKIKKLGNVNSKMTQINIIVKYARAQENN